MSTPTPAPPTPTPTLVITPWYTPTPWATANPADAPIHLSMTDIKGSYISMAEMSVQTWQAANQTGEIDSVLTGVLLIIVILGIISIRKRIENL